VSQNYETFGKYILLEKLATGGMAEVHLARNVGIEGVGKFVAIKRILPQFSEQTEFIDMFKDEAKIAINLSHNNIVSMHEVGIERHQFFIVMDFVEGRDLRRILTKMKKAGVAFSIEQALYIIREAAAGLDHAHRCIDAKTGKPLNIIHRDMSPQNVMVSFEGEVKVVDFGIAKAETQIESTRAGTIKGKFSYMSPEQAEGLPLDLRTDIFSLGILLWELLANDRLFVANNEVNTLRKIRDCQIPSLRKINPNIPPELERIVSKALAKDRNLRYQTSEALHRELSRFLNRQYPDFSPQDFAVFIKTLFASEILENRKKMIEYAKVEVRRPEPKSSAGLDKTFVTATSVTEASAKEAYFLNGEAPSPPPVGADRAGKGNSPSPQVPPPPPLRPEQEQINWQAPPQGPSGLRVERAPTVPGQLALGRFDGTSSSITLSKSKPRPSQMNGQKIGSYITTALIVIIVGALVSLTAYSLNNPKKFLSMVTGTLAKYGLYHRVKEVDPGQGDLASIDDVKVTIGFQSAPSGASIFLNDIAINEITPFSITLRLQESAVAGKPAVWVKDRANDGQEFDDGTPLRIRFQLGTASEEKTVFLQKDMRSTTVTASFKNTDGTLDISIEGLGKIYVDGKLKSDGKPAKVTVPAGRPVQVLAYYKDPMTKVAMGELRTVTVGENQTIPVKLIPRRLDERTLPFKPNEP
jgi:serine/threonine-protein kinase